MKNDETEQKKRHGWYVVRGVWCAPRAKALATGACLAWAISFLLPLLSLSASAASDEIFEMLQVGEHTYHNVTIRTKAKDYIFIVHSSGMTSIKVKDMPQDILDKLGYVPAAKRPTDAVAALAQTSVAKEGAALVEGMEARLLQTSRSSGLAAKMQALRTFRGLVVAAAVLLMVHLFCSYCCLLICQKTGKNPGILVWLPLLQAVPMLRAASMSTWWFGALFVPGLNLVAYGLWCVRIVKAREKTVPLALLLLFPLTSWFAFLFLAFSDDAGEEEGKLYVETMTLKSTLTSGTRMWKRMLSEGERHITA